MDSNEQAATELLSLAAFLLAKNLLTVWYCGRSGSGGGTQVGMIGKIVIYPVKSCSGVELSLAHVTQGGLAAPGGVRDRGYLVLAESGRFISLKACPRLSAVRPLLDPDRPGAIRLSAEGHPTLAVTPGRREVRVAFRSESLTGLDCGDEAADWLCRVCGLDGLRLVHCPRERSRPDALRRRLLQIGDAGGADRAPEAPLAYADASPILLLSDMSLKVLNERLAAEQCAEVAVDWRNFRPNLVVTGASAANAEDAWGRVRLGLLGPELWTAFPCERCVMVNLRYSASGLAETRPGSPVLDALARYRCWPPFRNPLFGANCAVLAPGTVAIGDPVFAQPAVPGST